MNIAKKKIILSYHATENLTRRRQEGVTEGDVFRACAVAHEILTAGVPNPLKLGGFISKEGVKFDMVVVDCPEGLKIVTIIGHKHNKRRRDCPQDAYRLIQHLPYKKMIKELKRRRKEEEKWQ